MMNLMVGIVLMGEGCGKMIRKRAIKDCGDEAMRYGKIMDQSGNEVEDEKKESLI
jgi:hypothetical protein